MNSTSASIHEHRTSTDAISTARHPIIVTIDGPAGTGKSSVAGQLAQRLGLEFLDTGAMYRAAALLTLEQGIDPADGHAVAEAVRAARLRFVWGVRRPPLLLGDRDVSDRVRDFDVSRVVSVVAGCAEVRTVMVAEQRRIAAEHRRLVTEGRDQGSVVFPDAAIRFFLDADPEVRAMRRVRQLEGQGKHVDVANVREDISLRDRLDSERTEAPLKQPEGSIKVDTTHLALDEVVDRLEELVRERFPEEDLRPLELRRQAPLGGLTG